MAPVTQQISEIVDCLPEAEQLLVLEIVKRFLPDDVATPDDIAAIQAARAEYSRGETVTHDDIDWS